MSDKLKVFEAFAGIKSQCKSLMNIGVDFEVVGISEVDKYAILSSDKIYTNGEKVEDVSETDMLGYLEKLNIPLNKSGQKMKIKNSELKSFYDANVRLKNFGDITKLDGDDLPEMDLFTYSFPCQDISVAGKQRGLEQGSNTRSSLLWHCEKVIIAKKPKFLLMENVKALVSKKFKKDFESWLSLLDDLGYNTYWQILNAKDFGIPQNRERVFAISIRKDIDTDGYDFPEKRPLTKTFKDLLEDHVDEKYYLTEKQVNNILFSSFNQERDRLITKDICGTLLARDGHSPICAKVHRIGGVFDKDGKTHQAGSVYDKNGLSPTLNTLEGGLRQSSIIEEKDLVIGASRGRFDGKEFKQTFEINKNNVSNTLTTVLKDNYLLNRNFASDFNVRKLTPKEYWRLMGFSDEDVEKASSINSDAQLYKQAGNSIVVNVLEAIFENLKKYF